MVPFPASSQSLGARADSLYLLIFEFQNLWNEQSAFLGGIFNPILKTYEILKYLSDSLTKGGV